jgi:hypothetical protein
MVSSAVATTYGVLTSRIVMIFLAAFKANCFLLAYIFAMAEHLALVTAEWVWDKKSHTHTYVTNFRFLGQKEFVKRWVYVPVIMDLLSFVITILLT